MEKVRKVVTYALDSSAVLRYADNEAGANRVEEILSLRDSGRVRVIMCALHWGEAAHILLKRLGATAGQVAIEELYRSLNIEIIPTTRERSERAALLRLRYKLPFADAFAVEIVGLPGHHLITADFDFKPAANDHSIEFLPLKPTS